jgi:glycosyltransferase involved in cell wall biosynthesis
MVRWARAPRKDAGGRPKVYILLMHAWGIGGTIRTTLNVAGHLAESNDVEILSMVRRREQPSFDFPPGVKVTAIDDQRRGGPLAKLLRTQRSLLMLPEERSSDACSLWTDVNLVRALRKRSPGVLLGTRPSLDFLITELAPPGFLKVGQEHVNYSVRRPPIKKAIRRYFPKLDLLLVLTEADLETYRGLFGDSVRVERMPNAVPPADGPPSPLTGTTALAVGRLTPQKGFDRLIPAFALVVEKHPDWKLRICGGGPQEKRLQKMIDKRGLSDSIVLTGPVDNIAEEMSNAAMFVLSSRFEGFPMVLLEAMGKALPIVSFDCPTGPREMIEHGVNGVLVPPGDVSGLAAAIIEMIEDEELRRRLGQGSLATAGDYSLEVIGARWDELLSDLRSRQLRSGGRSQHELALLSRLRRRHERLVPVHPDRPGRDVPLDREPG